MHIMVSVVVQQASRKVASGRPVGHDETISNKKANHKAVIMFMELLMSEGEQEIFLDLGLTPIVPPVSNNVDALPKKLSCFLH